MKEMVTVVNNKTEKHPEDREYLICILTEDSQTCWDIVMGRRDAYETIKSYIEEYEVNFDKSFILDESKALAERKSLYSFMKYAQQFFDQDDFDIENYVEGDWDEADYQQMNDIDPNLSIKASDRLSMQSLMMGGNTKSTDI